MFTIEQFDETIKKVAAKAVTQLDGSEMDAAVQTLAILCFELMQISTDETAAKLAIAGHALKTF